MALVTLKVGQPIFIIEDKYIYEGNITEFLNQKEVLVTSKELNLYQVSRTYGVDFFFTLEKARKILAIRLQNEKIEMKQKSEVEINTGILLEESFKDDETGDQKLMEITCFSCEFGDRLDFKEQNESGKQMFCRKHWSPIMRNEYENCLYFQPLKLVGIRTYLGGTCSGK